MAKNGEYTLILNSINVYSKYRPMSDAEMFIQNEFDKDASGFLLVGLGLGYHLAELLKLAGNKKIIVLPLAEQELTIFGKYAIDNKIINLPNVEIVRTNMINNKILSNYQVIIPLSWMKAIGVSHPLYDFLEDIKERQMSYQFSSFLMEKNFRQNIVRDNIQSTYFKSRFQSKFACLISAGPSLDETIATLEKIKDKFFILCVGAALKPLLARQIKPDAIVLSDATQLIIEQIEDTEYDGLLFYLSTTNSDLIESYKGKKCILLQRGYTLSETYAKQNDLDLFEVGGSVSTVGLSLLKYMKFSTILLFGQDLGFKDNDTHSKFSPSNTAITIQNKYNKILANSGELINTRADWNIFRRWFEREAMQSNVNIYNTAWHGTKIANIPYISNDEIYAMYDSIALENDFKSALKEVK
ncbi:6-hydroxymethylpterin diphosphokinase MptE-like protein [Lysinibacillus louembei]|uniref:6-hydroxymethylpterin diphosphokinase MptE-like protein n=1 Tax=Lysinibacillus louembei TaxID=1470088 RepID=A0ABZ0S479_9BACI|nr:6-hydroxymethylpterin diphosphokinase MptE-like protein [Lysinibacillus louembei]WPK12407.1 6-hydroxymethylpterin diphosphokinase MptE-like protein [Lysinibacillus louembei]